MKIHIILSLSFLFVILVNKNVYCNKYNVSVLEAQLKSGKSITKNGSFDAVSYDYSKKDLIASLSFLNDEYSNNLSMSDYRKKIKQIFDKNINDESIQQIYLDNPYSKYHQNLCDSVLKYNRNDNSIKITPFTIYLINDKRFITALYAIPEICDYKFRFSDFARIEENVKRTTKGADGSINEKHLWSSDKNLERNRSLNIKTFVSRNKYLLENDKTQLEWLLNNDEFFMELLIRNFGFAQDTMHINWFIKKCIINSKDAYDYGEMLWHKTCNDEIIIHDSFISLLKDYKEKNNVNGKLSKYLGGYIKYSEKVSSYLISALLDLIAYKNNKSVEDLSTFVKKYDPKGNISDSIVAKDFYGFKNLKEAWSLLKKNKASNDENRYDNKNQKSLFEIKEILRQRGNFIDSEGNKEYILTISTKFDTIPPKNGLIRQIVTGNEISLTVKANGKKLVSVWDYTRCEEGGTIALLEDSLKVTDLDSNGVAEVTLMYQIRCRNSEKPAQMKLIMLHGDEKYKLRGTKTFLFNDNFNDCKFNIDPSFNKKNYIFLNTAISWWENHLYDSLYEELTPQKEKLLKELKETLVWDKEDFLGID